MWQAYASAPLADRQSSKAVKRIVGWWKPHQPTWKTFLYSGYTYRLRPLGALLDTEFNLLVLFE